MTERSTHDWSANNAQPSHASVHNFLHGAAHAYSRNFGLLAAFGDPNFLERGT